MNYVPCVNKCNGVCAPGYYVFQYRDENNIYTDDCVEQCPYKYRENNANAKCEAINDYKIVEIRPNPKVFTPYT